MTKSGKRCNHRGEAVAVGSYLIYAGGTQYMEPSDLAGYDLLLPLTGVPELQFGETYNFVGGQGKQPSRITALPKGEKVTILAGQLPDFGGLPSDWEQFLTGKVIPRLAEGKKILTFCIGSHGRTGSLIASLIALLEPDVEDPIAEARRRHCHHAVETPAQARGIFALKGLDLPSLYS